MEREVLRSGPAACGPVEEEAWWMGFVDSSVLAPLVRLLLFLFLVLVQRGRVRTPLS